MIVDHTALAIESANAERERLRAEVERLTKSVETSFEKGYDQAVREIRDHFAKAGDHHVAAVIEAIWKIAFQKERP